MKLLIACMIISAVSSQLVEFDRQTNSCMSANETKCGNCTEFEFLAYKDPKFQGRIEVRCIKCRNGRPPNNGAIVADKIDWRNVDKSLQGQTFDLTSKCKVAIKIITLSLTFTAIFAALNIG